MCSQDPSFKGQRACICRNKKGEDAYNDLQAMAADLPHDWEQSVGWEKISEDSTGHKVRCGLCKTWWLASLREIKDQPSTGILPSQTFSSSAPSLQ